MAFVNLVTGGAGFIGSHLCERLLERGEQVVCLDNFFTGQKENIMPFLGNPRFELVRHDVTQPILIEGREAAQVTASVGVALAPEQGREFDRLFQLADLAMYEAKLKGKNRYAFAQGADVSPATPPAARATARH